jgi:4-hydroxyproline epimerase
MCGLKHAVFPTDQMEFAGVEIPRVRVIDSHTGGEPTRVVVSGGPDLGAGPMAERLERFRSQHDGFRRATVNEPRGSDVLVGALLLEPVDPSCAAGVIFFNNVGYLGMCGHGTIGLIVTLAHLGRIGQGVHRIETPVGLVTAELLADGRVSVENVASFRSAERVIVDVLDYGKVTGDVAWGGNWFFLVTEHPFALSYSELESLTRYTAAIRRALATAGIRGSDNGEIDHVELFVASQLPGVQSKNFVLCPGFAYDRSPCGTGTSAKLACLAASGKLAPGVIWKQESFVGSVFEASYRLSDGKVIPRITGSAYVYAETDLLLNPADPFCSGIS